MKKIAAFFSLFITVSILYYGCSQVEQTIILREGTDPIRLSTEYDSYVIPEDLELERGGTFAFQSEDGKDYAVIMRNANDLMEEVELNFVVRANGTAAPKYFTVNKDAPDEFIFEIYCLTNNSVPDAPPKIIVNER